MFTPLQIILIILATHLMATLTTNSQLVIKFGGQQVVRAFIIGLIMGDIKTALLIGGTMQLMAMGLAGYGGASIPNYNLAVIVGSAYAIANGYSGDEALALAMTIGIPAATLGLQLDVIAKTVNSFWYHVAEKHVEKKEYKKMYRDVLIGEYCFGKGAIGTTFPVALFLIFGQPIVEMLVTYMPAWLSVCLTTVSGVLPALGMALLMVYMPVKENAHWLVLGFILYVYFGLAILPIAVIGGIIAFVTYRNLEKDRLNTVNVVSGGGIGDE